MHANLHCYISSELGPSYYRSIYRRNADTWQRPQLSRTKCCARASGCPLLAAIEHRSNKSEVSFHVPGHKVCKYAPFLVKVWPLIH